MLDISLVVTGLAFLAPLGYALIAVGGLQEGHARQAALGLLAALALAALGYVATGFALQYGGVGLVYNRPGYEELVWEWSALGVTWGSGWGMAGLAGWGLSGPAATPGAYALAFANLPWVATAALIPALALRGRAPAWASALTGLLTGAFIYPLAGNWIWGGGWLANLGGNLGLGHGLVDAAGAGLVHLVGAAVALAGILVFLTRRPRRAAAAEPVPLPPVHLPLLAVVGAGLLLVSNLAWTVANPLFDSRTVDLPRLALNGVLAAAAGALLPLLYTWFVAGTPDPLMAARGFAAGNIAGIAVAPFVVPWAALLTGVAAGLSVTLLVFLLDHVVRLDDPTATLSVHGFGGILGLLAVAVFADGRAGVGWNGIGAASYLGVARQGVSGLLAAANFQPDFPAQLQAQAVGVAALALFGFFAAWVFVTPPRVLAHLLHWRWDKAPRVTPGTSVPRTDPLPMEEPEEIAETNAAGQAMG